MKVCSTCGDTFQDYVDFCFNDGEVLVQAEAGAVAASPVDGSAEAAPAPRRASATPASMMATPVPRDHRRSPPRHQGAQRPPVEPQRSANVPVSGVSSTAITLIDGDEADEDAPSAASLERTQPIEIGAHGVKTTDLNPRPQSGQAGNAPRAATFESEDEQDSSRLLIFGIAATLFGVFMLVAAGVVVVGMGTGLFNTGPTTDDVAVAEPLPAPLPREPLPSLVEPVPPPLPEPAVEPVRPVAPAPAPVVATAPAPSPPTPTPAPAPNLPAPAPVPSPSPLTAAPVPQPVSAPAPSPAPAVVAAVASKQPVTLTTDPPGAAIYLGGSKVLAATPGTVELEPGNYTLEARLANHASSTAAVSVADAPVTASFARLAPIAPSVKVTVMWKPGRDYPTEVTVDGAKIPCPIPCTTPMAAGAHVLRVLNVDGSTFETPVTIPSTPTFVVTLEPPT